jgi:hypothetical protein
MLETIQAQLEAIYGLTCEYRARDFLVDSEGARALGHEVRAREELLVSEAGGSLELALYLEPAMLARVSAFEHSPREAVEAQLPAFCEVAEGVSHFLYLSHVASLDRHVSLLELEAQAEVDKFALCALLHWGRDAGRWARALSERLFARVRFHPHLSSQERDRYQDANRLAHRYVGRLLTLVDRGSMDRLLSELRHAYRLGAEAKLRYFAGT